MTFQTGDALLTRSKGFISFLIRLSTFAWGKWNHVASIVVDKGVVWIYEVTTQAKRPDAVFGDMKDGARLERYENWIRAQGKVWHLKLSSPFKAGEAARFEDHCKALHRDRVSYDFPGAFFSAMPGRNKAQLKKTFCSAAHVSALVASGRLAVRTNFSEWHPNDVARCMIYRKPVRIK